MAAGRKHYRELNMNHVYIIAEAGVNHNGDPELAKKLIDVAAEAGADAVKFQTFIPELIASKYARKADYQKASTEAEESQLDMLRKVTLSRDDHKMLLSYAGERGIQFASTAFDLDSIDFLDSLDIPFYKIPSGEITDLPYLEKISALGKPVILSTGMSTPDEIRAAMDILYRGECPKISLLHCNTEYPTPYKDVNLAAISTMKREFGVDVGYSDHTLGIEVPIAAVAMGAVIIEKHFTLDRNMEGPDHKASLTPDELKSMVSSIRHIELAVGHPDKTVSESERKNIVIARKSIVAKRDIKKGEELNPDNITIKRPGSGISPMKWYEIIGKKAIRDFKEDELIEL